MLELRFQTFTYTDAKLVDSCGTTSQPVHQPTFTPRPRVQPINNCATVSNTVQHQIIELVTAELLSTSNCKPKPGCEGDTTSMWNAGGMFRGGGLQIENEVLCILRILRFVYVLFHQQYKIF